jgi:glycosyltransferase involved in cell wall biosynthesis
MNETHPSPSPSVPNRLRVLIVTNLYPRPGFETMAPFHKLLFGSLAINHDVTVLAPIPWTARLAAFRAKSRPDIPSWSRNDDGIWVARPTSFHTPRILRKYYGEMFERSIGRTFRRLVRQSRPDVVLASWAHPDAWATIRLARRARLPVAVMVIGSDVLVSVRDAGRRTKIAETLLGADAVLAVSRDLANHVERFGVDAARVSVLHTGVDPRIFHPGDKIEARRKLGLPDEGRLVLFVGNLLESKGAGVLIEALGRLKGRVDGLCASFVGGGKDEAKLRKAATDAGLGGIVTFRGRKPHSDLVDWYRACDLLCLPSDSEGIPNVLREATACGRPWVATNVGGIPEIADPAVDRLVPPRDPHAVADAIHATLTSSPAPLDSTSRVPCPTWDESAHLLAERLGAVATSRSKRP